MRSSSNFDQQMEVPIRYRDVEVGKHRLDLLVESMVVVELKTVRDFEDVHFVIVRSYLKALGLKHGLLMNFAKQTLEVRRVIYD
jgi:GxxExxY protein